MESYLAFSRLGNKGRLGNNFFQVASIIGLAKLHNKIPVFPEWPFLKYFQGKLNTIPNSVKFETVKEKHFHHYEWNFEENKNYDLDAYLQTEKYFLNCKDEIKELLTFKPEHIEQFKSRKEFEKETIAISVRRGDYIGNPLYYNIPVYWYISALTKEFPHWQECNILIFSDDVDYCKVHFEFLPNAYFPAGIEIDDLAMLTLCDNHILANSSFSWWGAYLSNSKKIVYNPKYFEGRFEQENSTKDLYPESWVKHEGNKIDLTDVTFTIPVLFDHADRKKNLDLCVCMLQTNFNTHIQIGEQGGDKFEYMKQWAYYMKFDLPNFHRTKMLNDMAIAANTPFIANWDADVIIPPMQIYMSVLKLRQGIDMVFPYDGRFARLPRIPWFKEIEKLLDIGAIGGTEPKGKRGRPVPESSVGGAVFFNKESFIDGGMENEYMISFGPEDCERNDRFTKLGFKKDRVGTDENGLCGKGLGGCLYHIDHWCGPDSSTQNPYFKENHKELEKGRKMTAEELRLYVDSFPWRHKYTEAYYSRISEGAIRSAKEVYKALDEMGIKYETVIDIGCGVGEWGYDLVNEDNVHYLGVDYGIPEKSLIIPKHNYINCDLEKEVYKDTKFDLCLCLEVAEHISEERADVLIEMLCNLSDKVLFSAAIEMQGGTGHINEKPATYWAEKFKANKFYPFKTDIRKTLFNNKNVEVWYRNNLILFTKQKFKIDYELDFVHPEMFTNCIQHYKNQLMQLQEV